VSRKKERDAAAAEVVRVAEKAKLAARGKRDEPDAADSKDVLGDEGNEDVIF
jgi:V-type H+-transporting ATPase subunit D